MSIADRIREGINNATHGTECVCLGCLWFTDTIVGEAGDFSVCARCHASITSKTGKEIRKTTQIRRQP